MTRSPYGSSKKPKPRKSRPVPSSAGSSSSPDLNEKLSGYDRELKHPTGKMWNRLRDACIEYHHGICHLCDHPMARQADHVIPFTERPDLAMSSSNLRPAHGSAGSQKNPCPTPTCGLNCNNIRGMGSIERARRIIASRQKDAPEVIEDGREWLWW